MSKPRKSFKRRLANWLFYLVLLVLLIIGAITWLTDTEVGFKTLVRFAKPYLATQQIQLNAKHVNGTLYQANISEMQVKGIHLQNTAYELSPRALLNQHLMLKHLSTTALIGKGKLELKLAGIVSLKKPDPLELEGQWVLYQPHKMAQGAVKVTGTLAQYHLALTAKTLAPEKMATLSLHALGSTTSLHSTVLTAHLLSENVTGEFHINFSPFHYQIQLSNPNLHLSSQGDKVSQALALKFHQKKWQTALSLNRTQHGAITISPLKLQTPYGVWHMATTHLSVQGKNINLPSTCLVNQSAHLCISLKTDEHHVNGLLDVNIAKIADFAHMVPQIENISGQIKGKMAFTGDWQKASYQGSIKLYNGQASMPEHGIVAQNVNAEFTSHNQPNIKINASAKLGKGLLKVQGALAWLHGQPALVLSINGKNVTVANLPFAHVNVSPALVFTQNKFARSLTGSIKVDSAQIDADRYRKQTYKQNPDIVFVNDHNQIIHDKKTLPFPVDIFVDTGKNTHFSGFGITTGITGQINIFSEANQPTVVNGRLHLVNGHYSAYGKHFTVSKGQLVYLKNPIDDPGIDVYATYDLTAISASAGDVSDITVGVHVTGSVRHVRLSMFSDPSMTQENILSYIITGGPLSSVGPGGQSALSQAAVSFAASGGNLSVLDKIRQSLSLNQLRVGSLSNIPTNDLQGDRASSGPEQNNTAVFIGKAITSRFYVSYGIGLFNQQQIFQTHFKLSHHWSIKTDNSTLDSGGDLIYTFEH